MICSGGKQRTDRDSVLVGGGPPIQNADFLGDGVEYAEKPS